MSHEAAARRVESPYRWVIVAAGGLLGCVAIGAMFSLPVFLQADRGGHRLVDDRHLGGDDHRLPGAGLAPAWAGARCRTVSGRGWWCWPARCCWRRVGARQPGSSLIEFQLAVRAGGRRRDGGDLRADDGLRDRLVRHAAQPCRVAGLGRHGHGADDHVAARRLAGHALRLAHGDADHRRDCGGDHDPGGTAGAPAAGAAAADRRRRRGRRAPARHVGRAGGAHRRSSSSCC